MNRYISGIKERVCFLLCVFILLLRPVLILIYRPKKQIWLVAEKENEARDNGYAFFNYLSDSKVDKDFYYIIKKNSYDLKKFNSYDRIIFHRSFKHYFFFAISNCLISSQMHTAIPYPYLNKIKILKKVNKNLKIVFLQHGILKDSFHLLTKDRTSIDLLICGGLSEFNYLKTYGGYSSSKGEIAFCGLPRFDSYSVNEEKKINSILIFPTFRKWLIPENFRTVFKARNEFIASEFFYNYNSLLSNKILKDVLCKNKISINFYLHYALQPYSHLFKSYGNYVNIMQAKETDLQKLIKGSDLLITDMSSIAFDFAYMRKSVIYFQFDKNIFEKNHYEPGIFEYENHGFGPVIKSKDKLVSYLSKYLVTEFPKREIFKKRQKQYFGITDKNNSARVYKAINKILD